MRWFGPSGGGGARWILGGGAGRQAPLQLCLRRATGATVAFHLSLLVVGVMHGVDMSWDLLRSLFVQLSPLYNNLSLVSKL